MFIGWKKLTICGMGVQKRFEVPVRPSLTFLNRTALKYLNIVGGNLVLSSESWTGYACYLERDKKVGHMCIMAEVRLPKCITWVNAL